MPNQYVNHNYSTLFKKHEILDILKCHFNLNMILDNMVSSSENNNISISRERSVQEEIFPMGLGEEVILLNFSLRKLRQRLFTKVKK